MRLEGDRALVVTTASLSHVAGDHDEWRGTELTQEDQFRWAVVPWSPGGRYKFTDGQSWEADPWSRAYGYDAFGEMSQMPGPEPHLEMVLGRAWGNR